jgi:hypothetical protein
VNPVCRDGGFHIAEVLRRLARKGLTHAEGVECCHGYEGSPKGRVRYGTDCHAVYKYTIDIEYRSAPAPEA